jgi:hypothetical protein
VDVTGNFSFTFNNINSIDGDRNLIVYNSSLKELENARVKDSYTYTSKTYNFKKGTILYIKISNDYYGAVGTEYSLAANPKKSTSWEQESDDSYSKAVP